MTDSPSSGAVTMSVAPSRRALAAIAARSMPPPSSTHPKRHAVPLSRWRPGGSGPRGASRPGRVAPAPRCRGRPRCGSDGAGDRRSRRGWNGRARSLRPRGRSGCACRCLARDPGPPGKTLEHLAHGRGPRGDAPRPAYPKPGGRSGRSARPATGRPSVVPGDGRRFLATTGSPPASSGASSRRRSTRIWRAAPAVGFGRTGSSNRTVSTSPAVPDRRGKRVVGARGLNRNANRPSNSSRSSCTSDGRTPDTRPRTRRAARPGSRAPRASRRRPGSPLDRAAAWRIGRAAARRLAALPPEPGGRSERRPWRPRARP